MIHWLNGEAPPTPYYASIFSSLKHAPRPGYDAMDKATMEAVAKLDGYLGYQVVHEGDRGIFVAYWRDMDAIAAWRHHQLHQAAKEQGKRSWYDWYRVEICRVEEVMEKPGPINA